MINPVTGSK